MKWKVAIRPQADDDIHEAAAWYDTKRSGLGDRETYRKYFRMAFETGYQDGLNGS